MSRGSTQQIFPGVLQSRFTAALTQPRLHQLLTRLCDKDASLWSANPAEQQHIRERLGWLSIVSVMESQVAMIQAAAHEIRQAGLTHALLLGMGGSSLFSEVCRATLGVAAGWLDLAVLDTTDPVAIAAAQRRAPLEHTLLIVSSKSGTTTESSALGDYFYEQLRTLKGDQAGQHCIAITDAGTPLEAQARQRQFRHVFVHGPTTGQDVGGRFSALTCFGLVPAALMGIDIRRLLARAKTMLENCQPSAALSENPAAQLAACLSEAAAEGRDKVTLLCAPQLAAFGVWIEQLIAESTGKVGNGLIPIHGEPLRDTTAYSPDRLFVDLQLAAQPDREVTHTVEGLAKEGYPIVRIRWQDEYDLGSEAIRWFLATALVASLMKLNPFDEPNVQESKDRTKALLERFAREGTLPSDEPIVTEGDVSVYGARGPRSIQDALQALLQQVRSGEYVAVLSFLPRTAALDASVEAFRNRLASRLGVATMLGYGPRYLHSTGQLHKGGPDRVALLFLTAEDPIDLPVPGKAYTFSVLKQAQAIGDVQALQERKRRVLRVHLGKSPDAAMARLLKMLDKHAATSS